MPKKLTGRKLQDKALELIAAQFKVLSEPARLKLLIALEPGEKNVSELVAATGMPQSNVSRHLQTLTEARLVSRRKTGAKAYYEIADSAVFALCEHVCGSLEKRFLQQGQAALLFGA